MKKAFKKLSKFAGYFFIYLIIALGSAVGVIFLSGRQGPDPNTSGTGIDPTPEVTVAPQIEKICDNIFSANGLNVGLDLTLESSFANLEVLIDAQIDLEEGFDNLAAKGTINLNMQDQILPINFKFDDGLIFIDVLNMGIYVETDSIMDTFNTLFALLNLEPIDIGFNLDDLDVNSILLMLSNLTETVEENKVKLEIDVPVVGKLSAICNPDYALVGLSMPLTTIVEGTAIAVDALIDYPDRVEVNLPAESDYINATDLFNIAEALITDFKKDVFGFDIEFLYDQYDISGNITLNKQDFTAKLDVEVFENELNLIVLNDTIYAKYQNIAVSFALADAQKLEDFLANYGINVPICDILGKINAVKQNGIKSIMSSISFDTSSLNFDKIDLGILQSLKRQDDTYTITLKDIGTVIITLNEKNIASIEFSGFDIDVKLKTVEPKEIFVPEANYVDIAKFIDLVDAAIQTTNNNSFVGRLEFNYDDINLVANFNLQIKPLRASIELSAFEQTVYIDIIDDTAYASYKNIKVSASINDIDEIKSFCERVFEVKLDSFDFDIEETAKDLIDPTTYPDLIGNVIADENSISLNILNDISASFTYNKTITSANIFYKNISAFVNFVASNDTITFAEVRVEDYKPITSILPIVENVLDYVNNGKYYVDFNTNVAFEIDKLGNLELEILGAINYENEKLEAYLATTIMDINVEARLLNNIVYLDIANIKLSFSLSDIDKILAFVKSQFGIDVDEMLEGLTESTKDLDILSIIEDIDIALGDNLKITYDKLSAIVNFNNNMISNAQISYDDISANVNIRNTRTNIALKSNSKNYVDIVALLPLIENTIEYVQNNKFFLNIYASCKIQKSPTESMTLNISGSVNYDEGQISAYATTTVDGIRFEVRLLNNIVYLKAAQLKISCNLDDIDTIIEYIQSEFDIDLKAMIDDLLSQTDSITSQFTKDTILTIIDSIRLTLTSLSGSYDEYNLIVNFVNDKIANATISSNDFTAMATIRDNISVIMVEDGYFNLTDIIPYVTIFKNLLSTKQFDLVANATVYEQQSAIYKTNDIALQVDFSNPFTFYANAKVYGIDGTRAAGFDLNIETGIVDEYLYFNYNGLMLKIKDNDLNELIAIVLQFLGIDPSYFSFILGSVAEQNIEIDMSALQALLPDINTNGSPLGYLNIFKSLTSKNNTLEVILDGSMISDDERAENMKLTIATDGTRLKKIAITNIYTGVTNGEHFDLEVDFNEFTSMTQINTNKKYIDISGSNELVKALINTSQMLDFEINATAHVEMSVPVLNDLKRDITLKIQVNIVDGKPEIYAAFSLPVVDIYLLNKNNSMYSINNDTTFSATTKVSSYNTTDNRDRWAYIFYKDGMVYFYRTEHDGSTTYQKKLMASLSTVSNDIIYYLQYLTGFSDDIIKAIRESLEREHEIDIGNVINKFVVSNNGMNYAITLNMQELTGDPNMNEMTIGLGIVKKEVKDDNGELVEKNFLGKATFEMDMPFTSSIKLKMTSDNLSLDSLNSYDAAKEGTLIDYTNTKFGGDNEGAYHYIETYPYAENEEWDAYSNNWQKAAEREFTVTFASQFDAPTTSFKGKAGTPFDLPVFAETRKEISGDGTLDIYEFMGWYADSEFSGSPITSGVIPTKNITYYAYWKVVEQYRTVYFYKDGMLVGSQYGLTGTELETTSIQRYIEVEDADGIHLYKQEFSVWYDDNDLPITKVPNYNCNLYAHYETYETLTKYNLQILKDTSFNYNGIGLSIEDQLIYNTTDLTEMFAGYDTRDTSTNQSGITTIYCFDGWYIDSSFNTKFDFTMPDHDTTIYQHWLIKSIIYEFTLYIYDCEELVANIRFAEGSEVELPRTLNLNADTKYYSNWDKTTNTYSDQTTIPQIMPHSDVTVYMRNKYNISYTYYVVENEDVVEKTYNDTIYQGERFTLHNQISDEFDSHYGSGELNYHISYTFNGYKYDDGTDYSNSNIMTNHDLSFYSDTTITKTKYYKIVFNVQEYNPLGWVAGSAWKTDTKPATPAPAYALEGTNFSLDGYILTYKGWKTAIHTNRVLLTYKSTTWGFSKWSNLTGGKKGFTSFTVDGSHTASDNYTINLYTNWEEK